MLNSNKRYDEHPTDLMEYNHVFGRQSLPKHLPLQSTLSGKAYLRFLIPIICLYLSFTELCALYFPEIFLGWLTHCVCFISLSLILYDLCPPRWTRIVEVSDRGVSVESHGVVTHAHWSVPLSQYRGVISVTHNGINDKGQPYREYGVALKHPDPTKTILLSLTPLPNEDAINHYATLLGVLPLSAEKYHLELQSKQGESLS